MLWYLILGVLLIAGISTGLIMASGYVNDIGALLQIIWDFIVGNLFGFVVLLLLIIFVVYVFKKLDLNKVSFKRDYSQKENRISAKIAKNEYNAKYDKKGNIRQKPMRLKTKQSTTKTKTKYRGARL